jgi:hypothetical protein
MISFFDEPPLSFWAKLGLVDGLPRLNLTGFDVTNETGDATVNLSLLGKDPMVLV